jgi:hypothetical protein
MGKMGNVFDDGFDFIAFSANKPTRFRPIPGMLSDGLGILSTDGTCKRPCEPDPECEELGPECFGDEESCQCYDVEGDPFESTSESGGVGGRCDPGNYCLLLSGGTPCQDCCQPGESRSECRRNWRILKSNNPNVFGDFSEGPCGLTQSEDLNDPLVVESQEFTILSEGEYLSKESTKSCGCSNCPKYEKINADGDELRKPSQEDLDNYANSTSERCCGRLQDGDYMNGEERLDIPPCLDDEGRTRPYTRKHTGFVSSLQKACFQCWCQGTISGSYKCSVENLNARCEKVLAGEGSDGLYSSEDECNAALENGETDCGVHWQCWIGMDERETGTSLVSTCAATMDAVNEENGIYLRKTDCLSACETGWSCKIVNEEAKCVEEAGGEFKGDDGRTQCESALASGSCGIRYECTVADGEKKCVATENTSDFSTIFDTPGECESKCVLEWECDSSGAPDYNLSCAPLAAYRPEGRETPINPDRFNSESECESAVANGTCADITYMCRIKDGSADCFPIEWGGFGAKKNYYECKGECETRYR